MALTLDDILKKSGGDPAIQKTLQGMGINVSPTSSDAQQLQSVPEHVPYYLQADPTQVTERDQNPVPPSLRANPGQASVAPIEDSTDDDSTDDDSAPSRKPASTASAPSAKKADDSDDYKGEEPIHEAQPAKPDLDFGDQNASGLADAIQAKNNALGDARIQRGAEQIAAGISRVNPNTSGSDELEKHAGDPVDQFKLLQEDQANDPSSGLSMGLRDYMKKLGVNVAEGTTAAQIQKVMPYVYKDIEAKQAQAAKSSDQAERLKEHGEEVKYRMEALKLQKQALAQNKEQARQDRLDKEDTNRLDKMSKGITSEVASSRSAFGQASRNIQAIQNAKALLSGESDPNNLDNRQVYEANKVLDRILSQGNPSISGTAHLTPETARADFAKYMEYFSNQRQGAGAGDFLGNIGHTLDREEDQANKQIATTQNSLLSSYKDLQKRHPEQYNEVLRQHNLPVPGESHPTPVHLSGPPVSPRDEAALATIKKNNPGISDEDAQQALIKYKQSKGHQ